MDAVGMKTDSLMDKWQEDVTLKLWDGDETAISDILSRFSEPLQIAICKRYSTLLNADAEDVLAIAIWKFWKWREQYDPSKGPIQVVLYQIARRIAEEWRSGRRKWQQAKLYEQSVEPETLEEFLASTNEDEASDDQSGKPSPLHRAFQQVFSTLPPLHQDIWQA